MCGGVAGGGEHAGHCVLARPRVASLAASSDLLVSIAQQRHDLAVLLLQVQQLGGQLVLGLLQVDVTSYVIFNFRYIES